MTTLRGITWDHPRGYDCVVAASTEYAAQFGVGVRWDKHPLSAFEEAPIEQLAANYDLMVLDHPHIPEAVDRGAVAQLDGHGFDEHLTELASQSVGPSHSTYSYRGHQYGLATDSAAQVAVYRPDLLGEPPTDWDGVFDLARDGRVMWPGHPVHALSSLVTLTANAGAPPTGASGVFLHEQVAGEALDLLHRLVALVPAESLEQNPIMTAEAMATSDRYAYAPLAYGYVNYSQRGFRQGRLKHIDIP
ncbi:MAG TPA: extracellular solute-binding protein, partial [Brevibacterium sp.]|nr:extracellular solute-binding protein [Brevibacterium sp.]